VSYFIWSKKHSPSNGNAVWWRENNSGYTVDLDEAGVYTKKQVDAVPGYYNNGHAAVAVPRPVAYLMAKSIVDFGRLEARIRDLDKKMEAKA